MERSPAGPALPGARLASAAKEQSDLLEVILLMAKLQAMVGGIQPWGKLTAGMKAVSLGAGLWSDSQLAQPSLYVSCMCLESGLPT